MYRSGSDIIVLELRRSDGRTFGPTDDLIEVEDDAPWLELRLSARLGTAAQHRLESDSGGVLEFRGDPDDRSNNWYRWSFWKPIDADARRRGVFQLGGGAHVIRELRAYVQAIKIFTPQEHQAMVDAIIEAMYGATWDEQPNRPGVAIRRTIRRESIAELLDNTRDELRLAESVQRSPLTEFIVRRPGTPGLPGSPRLSITNDLPENHVVGWWAAHRNRELRRAQDEARAELERRRRTRDEASQRITEHRLDKIRSSISTAERSLAEIATLQRRVANLVRPEPPAWPLIGPAITRDSRRRRLLEALRGQVETPQLQISAFVSRFRERPTSKLFELWGAIALVQTLVAEGWKLDQRRAVRWLDSFSPERMQWELSLGTDKLIMLFEPHVEQPMFAEQPPSGLRMSRLQRAAANTRETDCLFCGGSEPSPDYALILRTANGVAFALGDAQCSDLKYLQEHGNASSMEAKIKKVANRYAHQIAWRSYDRIVSCSVPASFVIVPGETDDWLAVAKISEACDDSDVLLLGARPRSGASLPIDQHSVARIVATLFDHAAGGANRVS